MTSRLLVEQLWASTWFTLIVTMLPLWLGNFIVRWGVNMIAPRAFNVVLPIKML